MSPDQDVALPQDNDDDVDIPASQMSAAGAAFAAQISNSAVFLILIVVTINLVVTIKCHVVNVKKMFSASPLPTSQKKITCNCPTPLPQNQFTYCPPPRNQDLLALVPSSGAKMSLGSSSGPSDPSW